MKAILLLSLVVEFDYFNCRQVKKNKHSLGRRAYAGDIPRERGLRRGWIRERGITHKIAESSERGMSNLEFPHEHFVFKVVYLHQGAAFECDK